jgi:hypothetical protein
MVAKAKPKAAPVKAAEPGPVLVKVTAVHPYQIGYEGQVVGPGESLDVPAVLADQWVASGIATR